MNATRECFDADGLVLRLEEAGATLLALPQSGPSPRLRMTRYAVLQDAAEAYGWERGRMRPAMPSHAQISRMDEALAWITLIPVERFVLRRVVGARCLVNPVSERHLFSWRRLGDVLGADHKAVQRWHGQGIALILAALTAQEREAAQRLAAASFTA